MFLQNATHSWNCSCLQMNYLYDRKVFTSLVESKYENTWFRQLFVIHFSSMYVEARKKYYCVNQQSDSI